MTEPITLPHLQAMKSKGEKIAMATCYDFSTAKLVDRSEIDGILVGDSLGMTMLGYENTLPVTMDDMITFGRSVVRGAPNTERGAPHERNGLPLREARRRQVGR